METYRLYSRALGWDVYRGSEKIGRSEGRRLCLTIPVLDYCKRHGLDPDDYRVLARFRHRELRGKGRLPSRWRTFELVYDAPEPTDNQEIERLELEIRGLK